jgi:hypothetical protein
MVGKLTNDEIKRMWKKDVMAFLKILFWIVRSILLLEVQQNTTPPICV